MRNRATQNAVSLAMSIATVANGGANLVVALIFLTLIQSPGSDGNLLAVRAGGHRGRYLRLCAGA